MTIERARLDQIAGRLHLLRGRGEEATKQALVLPMLDALGYDIWHPSEVSPEFEADFATKKLGQKEKVDYAILLGDVPRVYIEVKAVEVVLDGHEGQLARYFNATPSVSLAILTNGLEYRFYTDTAEPNIMDGRPFYTFRVDAIDPNLDVLARFHRQQFSPTAIRDYATELNYTSKVVGFLRDQLDLRDREPSDQLVRWILGVDGMYDGMKTATVLNRFRPIVRNSLQLVLRDIVRRSVAALDDGVRAPAAPAAPAPAPPVEAQPADGVIDEEPGAALPEEGGEARTRVTTSEREIAAFEVIRQQFMNSALSKTLIYDSSSRREVPLDLAWKDTQAYFGVYFNKPGWWFARIVMDSRSPWLSLNLPPEQMQTLIPPGFTALPGYAWAPSRIAINGPDDLHALNRVLFAAMQRVVDERRTRA